MKSRSYFVDVPIAGSVFPRLGQLMPLIDPAKHGHLLAEDKLPEWDDPDLLHVRIVNRHGALSVTSSDTLFLDAGKLERTVYDGVQRYFAIEVEDRWNESRKARSIGSRAGWPTWCMSREPMTSTCRVTDATEVQAFDDRARLGRVEEVQGACSPRDRVCSHSNRGCRQAD